MSVMHRLRIPRSLTAVLVLLMALALVLSGVAIAETADKAGGDAARQYTTAEYRGSSTGFGAVVKTDSVTHSTTSGSPVDMPEMSIRYNVNPNAPKDQMLLITYSGDSKCLQNPVASTYCYIRVLVDGNVASPGNVAYNSVLHASGSTETLAHGAHSMQFVYGPVGPGPHFVTVQYWVDETNATFEVWDRTLSVIGFYYNQTNVINP